MTEWMHAHPLMTFAVLLFLVDSIKLTFTIPLGSGQQHVGDALSKGAIGVLTPDDVREHMMTPRQRAAKVISDAIASFRDDGNPKAVILLPYDDIGDNVMIAELLEYKNAGWLVEFYSGCAAISLPEVLS